MPKPQLPTCHLCGQQFGSSSLAIHQKTCAQRVCAGWSTRLQQILHAVETLVQTIHSATPVTLTDVQAAIHATEGVDPEVQEFVLGWLGDTPVGTIVTSESMGDVLLFDHGANGDALRCREIHSSGLSEVKPLDDIDPSAPVRFESRIDFEYEPIVIDIDE